MKRDRTHNVYRQSLHRFGGSRGLVLPKPFAEMLEGEHFFIYRRGADIVLSRRYPVALLRRVVERLRGHYGEDLLLVVLYGSVARGLYRGPMESDIDLFVVTRGKREPPGDVADLEWTLSIVDWPLEKVERVRGRSLFLEEVKGGITLYGDPSLLS